MFNEFKNPSNKFRPIPFWSWNDKLEVDELKNQINEMKKARVGGYFMHARSGLKTEYLDDEWFDCIKAGIEAGKETGLHAWAYDENGWPSGFAGGIVPAMSEDYHAKFISLKKHKNMSEVDKDSTIACFVLHEADLTYEKIDMTKEYQCQNGEILLAIKRNANQFYIDTMNKRAVDAFLQTTHEEYYKRFGADFGEYMKGFFTDEPRLTCDFFLDLAWSDDLPGEFLKEYGYEIIDKIPALYYDVEGYEKVRYDFWSLVNHLFVQNFMKNIYDWCDEHNCKLTGHVMMEESIFSQVTSTGGVMPFYEYEHTPGIDWLRRPIGSPVVPKQVGSVACQLGKKQILTESFALSGWDVSFEELKWIAEWQFVNGVNQICQHLQSYTIKGVRKRDYPPSLFTQQTWWDEYGKFNDYLGRLCVVLSEGDQQADVLLLHPMKSGYVLYDGTRTDAIRELDDKFTEASEMLSGLHISYHYGDETLIKKYGDVKEDAFVVGLISYKTVIMPQMYAIDGRTLKLLLQFAENGGTIISLDRFPTYTNGDMDSLKILESKTIRANRDELRGIMAEKDLLALSIAENGHEVESIAYQIRDTEHGTLIFMVNHNQTETFTTKVKALSKKCRVTRMIAETGETQCVPHRFCGNDTEFELVFEPMQSYIILLEDKGEAAVTGIEAGKVSVVGGQSVIYGGKESPVQNVKLSQNWNIDRMDLNSMTLDMCRYRIDDGEWQGPVATIKLQGILLDLQRACKVQIAFDFEVEADLNRNKEFYVVVEDASMYEIRVNGQNISYTDIGWWKDKTFKKVDIKSAVQTGKNEIILNTTFTQPQKVYDVLYGENVYETEINKITYDMEIENIYLLGDFGVISRSPFVAGDRKALITEGPFVIVDAPKTLTSNNFTANGLLFFAGTMNISQKIQITREEGKRVVLHMGKQKCPWIKVYVNGEFVKDSLWAPYEADITEFVKEGINTVTYEVFASNRNLFGPHHHCDGECYNVGPESFTGKWSWVERKSEADATEIFDMDKDFWVDTYCFVEFGV